MNAFFPFAETTRGVTIRVSVSYLPEQSEPQRGRWFWAYHVRIENEGVQAVRLMTRHWIITDGRGARHSVEGEGVVGEQPLIAPGESYDYVSGCPLATPTGPWPEGTANSVMTPPVVMRPSFDLKVSLNHIAPSAPLAIPTGPLPAVGVGYSVITPPMVIRPILSAPCSVNHMAPSGPATMAASVLVKREPAATALGSGNSVMP